MKTHLLAKTYSGDSRLWSLCGAETKTRKAITGTTDLEKVTCNLCSNLHKLVVPDARPHSRACGIRPHPHGALCNSNCPTCQGKL